MSDRPAIRFDRVSKKFTGELRKSMLYGMADIGRDLVGLRQDHSRLRPGEFWAVDDVSFAVEPGECVGVIGPNGAGKSTILKMLGGLIAPDRGRVEIRGRVGSLIEIGAGFHPLLSGRENIYINGAVIGLSRKRIDRDLDSIIDFSGVGEFIDMPVKFYSSGMYVRLGFAVAIHMTPEVLLLDEILAVGDVPFQAKCFNEVGRIREQGAAVILVSHNLHRVAGFCDRVMYLRDSRVAYDGGAAGAIKMYLEDARTGSASDLDGEGSDMGRVHGSGRITITSVTFLDREGRPVDGIRAGDPLRVRLDYRAAEEVTDPVLDIVIRGPGAENYFQASNLDYNTEMGPVSGRGHLEVEFEKININNQHLEFFFALWNRGHTELFDWKRHLPLKVEGVPTSTGILMFDLKWRNVSLGGEGAAESHGPSRDSRDGRSDRRR